MTDLHPRVIRWLQQHYPKPTLDPDWLNDCLDWLINQQHYSLDTDPNAFYAALESQLLQSNLQDSMLHGTGLPIHIALPTTTTVLTGPPILVEISAMTEIAHSAFNLDQIRAAREERSRSGRDMSNNIDEDGDIDVDEGPPPKYSRGMLRFTLTDGATSLPAIEYKPIPQLVLGVTPLGYKVRLPNTS
ncbi:hypothetical protein AMATHDRAFT_138651 [Amanita thiersii Skay4041]|uniref:RecQ-mediated genome instability protein 1 n=1 Tax=Amanita thiersii Skay4041 TaxID=703135 RepID=A0A2A9NQV9_9AGAR|nr:hypothetical protein AMATHDRAFT_138651 [Amanita thiersii Skay4041]